MNLSAFFCAKTLICLAEALRKGILAAFTCVLVVGQYQIQVAALDQLNLIRSYNPLSCNGRSMY